MPAALLFDLDGTMLLTDPIHESVFEELWRSRGLPWHDRFYAENLLGRRNVDMFAEFLPEEADPEALSDAKEAEFRRRLPNPFPPMPGLRALIDRARAAGWRRAVVTNAMRPNAEAMLTAIGLRGAIDTLVIGEECPRGKPDPYPYAEACRVLDIAPEDAIAFEDSPSGIAAARSAGIATIALTTTLSAPDLLAAGANATISDFTDPALPALLARPEGTPA